jgi:hypothetical protein
VIEKHTASCFSLLPKVSRIAVSLDNKLRYWVASASFSSLVRFSSFCSLSTGSRSSESSDPLTDRPFVVEPLERVGGGEKLARSSSPDKRRLARDCSGEVGALVGEAESDLEGIIEVHFRASRISTPTCNITFTSSAGPYNHAHFIISGDGSMSSVCSFI